MTFKTEGELIDEVYREFEKKIFSDEYDKKKDIFINECRKKIKEIKEKFKDKHGVYGK